jgi:hypothetical protein
MDDFSKPGSVIYVEDNYLTLRDRFAIAAMNAIISKTPFQEFPKDFKPHEKTAIGAYEYADAMLEERNKK